MLLSKSFYMFGIKPKASKNQKDNSKFFLVSMAFKVKLSFQSYEEGRSNPSNDNGQISFLKN